MTRCLAPARRTARRHSKPGWGMTTSCWTTWVTALICCISALPLPLPLPGQWPVASGRCGQTLADADGPLRQRCGVQHSGAACLRRPDQHVCARWLTLDACRLQAAQATALPHRTPLMTTIDPNHALPGLSVTGMETVYDTLASAIDQAGPAETALLLVKLALLQARALGQALGQASSFQAQVQAALQGL